MRRATLWAAAMTATAALTVTACGGDPGGATDGATAKSSEVEVFSWWTSGSEAAALDALISHFKKANPGVAVQNGAVSGGGGSNAQQVLQTRLVGGNPPDTWQAHTGKAMTEIVDNGFTLDLTDVYTSNKWQSVIPRPLIDKISKDGKIHGVFTGVHRGNVLWFNKKVLSEAGIEVGDSLGWKEFTSALDKLKAKGETALCLGDKDIFASAEVLENVLVGRLGAQGWNRLVEGETRWSDPEVRAAVKDYTGLLDLANADHSALTWDQAVKRMADGGCAFNTMGDWAYGELLKLSKKDGEDFGYVAFPGSDKVFVTVGDVFVASASSEEPDLVKKWMESVGSKESQLAFNKAKGSTPARTDVDVSSLGAYQQAAAKSFREETLVSTLVHGEAAPPRFQQSFFDAVNQLNAGKDIDAFVKALDAAARK